MAKGNKIALRQWALVGILLLAFGLRIYRLGVESLWYDETVSVYLAGKSIPALVSHTAGDIHPPGYYLLLHIWIRLAGSSEFAAAFLSLFFGLLLVALAYRLAAHLFGAKAGLLAASLVAISPYNLWYSQEVRMYTLGAVLGVCLLGAVVSMLTTRSGTLPAWSQLAVYAFCGALGLWTLYYFAFLMVAINLMVAAWWFIAWRRRHVDGAWLGRWLLAQGVVLLLYAPWIPVAWRQAIHPPVPPWRGFTRLGEMLLDTWSALSLGQSIEPAQVWPVLLLVALVFGVGLISRAAKASGRHGGLKGWTGLTNRWLLAGYVFIPIFLIYLASFLTPLYHVRYAFTYSTPFYVILGAGLAWLGQRWRAGLWLGLLVIVIFSGISIHAYHTDPRYASDDHRAATRFLAESWRPGDAILVNAGYAYTAPVTYWDGDPLAWRGRLVDDYGQAARQGPVMVQTGVVDGDPSLGWGDPNSDFYAMDSAESFKVLERLFADFDRVWVYRIYDTVTDPEGILRRWLDEHGILYEDRAFTGESQLRMQGFLTGRDPLPGTDQLQDAALADGSLRLTATSDWAREVEVGEVLDLALVWDVGSMPGEEATLFAGLFDEEGRRWAQTDAQPLGSLYPPAAWPPGARVRTPLRVLVPPGTPPGHYRLEVGWYRFQEGQPVWLPWASGERLPLGEIEAIAPRDWSALPRPTVGLPTNLTMGEGVRFLGFDATKLVGHPGDILQLDLFWQALEDTPEAGMAVLQLTDETGKVLAETSSAPAGGQAPFSGLAAGQTVRDPRSLTLPPRLAPGVYNLTLGRQSPDGTWLPVRRDPLALGSIYPLATVRVLGRSVELTPPAVQYPVDARFDEAIRLIGYDLEPQSLGIQAQSLAPSIGLTLHWQALMPMGTRYKIFAHLVGEGGPADIRAQADIYPHLPTTGWLPGEYLADRLVLDLPADLPPGSYGLLLGLYDEATNERLLVLDVAGQAIGDSLLLKQIPLEE